MYFSCLLLHYALILTLIYRLYFLIHVQYLFNSHCVHYRILVVFLLRITSHYIVFIFTLVCSILRLKKELTFTLHLTGCDRSWLAWEVFPSEDETQSHRLTRFLAHAEWVYQKSIKCGPELLSASCQVYSSIVFTFIIFFLSLLPIS